MMEIENETRSLDASIYLRKSTTQQNYMKSLQECLDQKSPQMMEIARTEEKIDSTLKVLINHKLNSKFPYKQIIICCQKESDAKQYFSHIQRLSLTFPEIKNKLLILKLSNKNKLCIEPNRLQHANFDEELFCKYKRKVAQEKCQLYNNFKEYVKIPSNDPKGLYDEDEIKDIGSSKNICPYFFQYHYLLKDGQADIVICEHHNIFKEKEKQKDVYQQIQMGNQSGVNETFLFMDQSQFLLEDLQAYNSFNLDQELIHKTIYKCRSIKKIIFEDAKLQSKENINQVAKKYEKLIDNLQDVFKKQFQDEKKKEEENQRNKTQQQQINKVAVMPEFVKNPILLIDYIENVSYELNSLFEDDFSKRLAYERKNQGNPEKSIFQSTDTKLKKELNDLKKIYPMHFQIRLVLDELFCFMHDKLFPLNTQEKDQLLPSVYIIGDFAYFFTENFVEINPYQQNQHFRCFFQHNPEHLKEPLLSPILSFAPTRISPISRKFFDSCKNFALTSDCVIQRSESHSSTIFGLDPKIPVKRFELEPSARFNVLPLFITKWNDQSAFESSKKVEDHPLQLRNYVNIVNSICDFIPDGIVVYLPNISVFLSFLKEKVGEILSNRPIFFENPFSLEKTLEAFQFYKKNCDVGGGALFFCVANGLARRHIEFADHYARAALILGYPMREDYYRPLNEVDNQSHRIYNLPHEDFLTYDAITQVASCIKSVYTRTHDHCTIILADQKLRSDSDYLPKWANQNIRGQDELTVDDLFAKILEYSKCMGKLDEEQQGNR